MVSIVEPPKRAVSPELARISALITRHPKQKNKVVEASGSELFAPSAAEITIIKTEPKKKESKKATFAAASSKETIAFYHVSISMLSNIVLSLHFYSSSSCR